MQHLVLYTVVPIAIFISLHGPAGACIPVASASPIHVFPIQHVLKHCGAHKHSFFYIHICDPKQSYTPAGGLRPPAGV